MVVGRSDMAQLLGVSPARVSQLIAAGMPALASGKKGRPAKFDAAVCLAWAREREREQLLGALGDKGLRDEQTRWTIRKLQSDVREREGTLVDVTAVEASWARLVGAARERLLSLPAAAVQRRLVTAEGEDALSALVDEALTELAARGGKRAGA